jgi:hypothetical protein
LHDWKRSAIGQIVQKVQTVQGVWGKIIENRIIAE